MEKENYNYFRRDDEVNEINGRIAEDLYGFFLLLKLKISPKKFRIVKLTVWRVKELIKFLEEKLSELEKKK